MGLWDMYVWAALFRSLNPLQVTFGSAAVIMNAEAVSQLVTVLEKTTSPDQVLDCNERELLTIQLLRNESIC